MLPMHHRQSSSCAPQIVVQELRGAYGFSGYSEVIPDEIAHMFTSAQLSSRPWLGLGIELCDLREKRVCSAVFVGSRDMMHGGMQSLRYPPPLRCGPIDELHPHTFSRPLAVVRYPDLVCVSRTQQSTKGRSLASVRP